MTKEEINECFVGKTIKEVKLLDKDEREAWGNVSMCITFTDGSYFYPTRDEDASFFYSANDELFLIEK